MLHTRHIIHRQSVEVTFDEPGERRGIQDRLAEVYYERILPQLDQLFSEFGTEHDVVTVPKLLIDCGVLHETNWEEELTASICSTVRDELRQYHTAPGGRRWDGEFIHFLQTGSFQWESRKKKPAEYEEQLILDTSLLAELTRTLRTSSDALKRLYHYCSSDFIVRLAKALAKDRIPSTDITYLTFLEQGEITEAVWASAVVSAYHTAYCRPIAGPDPKKHFIAALAEKIWSRLDRVGRASVVEQLIKQVRQAGDTALEASSASGLLANVLPWIANEFPGSAAAIRKQIATGLAPVPEEPITTQNSPPIVNPVDVGPHPDTAHYIANAGLVLAYPFLAPLLQSNGFLGENQQLSPAVRGKAATLFQYLVYESPTLTDESGLPLNKVLAGLQPTTFVDPSLVEPTAQVLHECEVVLEAIITHWEVLRNTTIAGLRETFLQRTGKLTWRTSGWLLQVDASGVDVLLASLPWPIGIIKLPWMDSILHVEWT